MTMHNIIEKVLYVKLNLPYYEKCIRHGEYYSREGACIVLRSYLWSQEYAGIYPIESSMEEKRIFIAFKKLFFMSRICKKRHDGSLAEKECLQSFRQLFFHKRNV